MEKEWAIGHEQETPALKRSRRRLLWILIAVLVATVPVAVALTPECAGNGEVPLTYADSHLYISEYMTTNTHFYDEQGDDADWIEVGNSGTETLNLRGFALVMGSRSFMFPSEELEPGEYALVWLDGGGHTSWHAPFKLVAEGGETVYLKNSSGHVVDEIVTQTLVKNTSVTRLPDGAGGITATVSAMPTPGFENTEAGAAAYTASRYIENDTGIILNEILAANGSAVADEFGNYVDYIELHNTNNKAVDIGGFGLSDREDNPLKWAFPEGTTIPANGYVLVHLSPEYELVAEDGTVTMTESQTGAYLAPFGLSKLGETVFLTNSAGYFLEKVETGELKKDQVLVRQPDGGWARSFAASPGYANTAEGVEQSQQGRGVALSADNMQISEASSRNTAYVPVEEQYFDWIELYNPTDKPLCLSGYTLSDDLAVPDKYALPDVTVPAGGYYLLYATDQVLEDTPTTGFNLNGSCFAALFSPEGKQLDYIRLTELPQNVSKGRVTGDTAWVYFATPTPGKANGQGFARMAEAPTADVAPGIYDGVERVTVTLSGEGTIHYTTDGSVPTAASPRYTGPLTLNKTTALRAVCIADGAVTSTAATFSYILNGNHTADVLSLVSDPDGLFSEETGIYATGPNASSNFPYSGANFWKDWERACTAQLLSQDGKEAGFSVDCGLSIFGAYSRAYTKKSMKIRFRDIYGSGKLNYPVFSNRDFTEYECLVIRTGGQDSHKTMIKDDLTVSLADGLVDTMATRPVVLYVNGEYYGMYYIREKISDDFVASHYKVSPESVDLLQANGTVNAGSDEEWDALMDYVKSHDLSVDANYRYVTERIDVQNYVDYLIAELYCGNTDQGNIRFFRSSEGDGKWRWILYDTDLGFQGGRLYSAWELFNPNGTGAGDAISTTMVNKLFKNDDFRALFVARLEYQMDNVWNTERVLSYIDRFVEAWGDEGQRNHDRWGYETPWEDAIFDLKYFTRNRMDALRDEFETSSRVRNIIALTDEELDR
ncbi:MAG: CotH kinase family protein, partial [Clostridia bacterium]|nr:CotH kinase family protein [Clostridia bacterium]